MNCKRCGESRTLFVVGDRYCAACKRDVAAIERRSTLRVVEGQPRWRARLVAKDMTYAGDVA